MSRFIPLTGEDPSQIMSAMGRGNDNNTKGRRPHIEYTPLPHSQMLRIYDYYNTQEPLIGSINQLKNFSSLGNEVEIDATYGGRKIPEPERTQVNEALNILLPEFRAMDDMFGFAGIYDPNAYQDRQTAEIIDEPDQADDSAHIVRAELVRTIEGTINQLSELENPESIKERLIDQSAPNSDENGRPKLLADRTSVDVYRGPITSATMAPEAYADIQTDGTEGRKLARKVKTRVVKVRRTLMQAISSIAHFKVVSLEEGRYYLEKDKLNGNVRVVFARNVDNTDLFSQFDHAYTDDERMRPTSALNVDFDVYVHVWPGKEPLSNGRINTKIEEVMRLRDLEAQAEENLSRADTNASNPTAIYEFKPTTNSGDVTRLTDQQVHFGGGIDEDAALADKFRNEGRRSAMFDAHHQITNGKRFDELTQRLAAGVERKTVVGSDGKRRLQMAGNQPYITLPEGFHFGGTLQPKTIADLNLRRHNYRAGLASALGMPLSMVEGGSTFSGSSAGKRAGSSGGAVSSGSAELSNSAFVNAIMTDRRILKGAVASMWNIMFRDTDNDMLASQLEAESRKSRKETSKTNKSLALLRKRLEDVTSLSELERDNISQEIEAGNAYLTTVAARLDAIATELRAISSMNNRFSIEFTKLTHVPIAELEIMRDSHAMSEFEFANALRQRNGLSQFKSEGQWLANRKKALDMRDEDAENQLKMQAKYAPKPAAPGGGASSSSSSGSSGAAAAKKKPAEGSGSADKKRKAGSDSSSAKKQATGSK